MPTRLLEFPEMYLTTRQARWYRKARLELIELMGGNCHYCMAETELEFHHLGVRTWIARKKSRWQRIALYRQEAYDGALVLACRSCNAKLGKQGDSAPFL